MSTDLLGDPLPDYTPELPRNEQFSEFDQLVGHTIKAVFDPPTGGHRSADLVVVTETGCWIAAEAAVDGCGDDAAYLSVKSGLFGGGDLSDYCSAAELHRAGVISQVEHDFIALKEAERKAAYSKQRADSLRAELKRLEGGAA